MKGRRVDPDTQAFKPGDYGKNSDGEWYCRPPGKKSHLGSLQEHTVTEHEDGTITVSPSILIDYPAGKDSWKWHGYLERGIWREV